MGQSHKKNSERKNERAYFSSTRSEMLKHFSKTQVIFEKNSSEWVVILREELSRYKDFSWARPVLALVESWENLYDCSSRLAFVWNEYQRINKVRKIDQTRACLWPQSIANLQTFTYEVETDPQKRILNGLIQQKEDCIIHKIIQKFKTSFISFYCDRNDGQISLRPRFIKEITLKIREIDEIVLDFIRIIVRVIPKFFVDFPACTQDIEEIVRNAVVSEDMLKMLVILRKMTHLSNEYLKNLAEFEDFRTPTIERLEQDKNQYYLKAIGSFVEIPASQSIGEIHDAVAMLMNYISMGLYDENNAENMLEEEQILQAFLHIIGKSAVAELPVYVDILNTFLDSNTLTVKSVGQGIMKLTYIIHSSADWNSFMINL
jgi:hypothetical protein